MGAVTVLAQGQPIDALIRQHERAVQDATRREPLNADVFTPDAPDAVSARPKSTPSANCRLIQKIRLEGHPDSAGAEPQDVIARYVGQCLIADEVNALLGELNRWYQKRGLTTTRAYAAEQDLSKGELVLRIIAGRIEGYRYIDKLADARLAEAFPGKPGEVLNVRDLEQGLENFNRIPSQEAKFQLYPGKEPGTSDVVVELVEKKTWRVTEMVDNSGNKTMGNWRSNTELAIDNPLMRNDQLALGYNRNLDSGTLDAKFEGFTMNYLISSGYHLFGAAASTFHTSFTLPGVNQSYLLQTHSSKGGLSYEYLFARDQESKHTFISGLDFTTQRSYASDIQIESQYRRLSVFYVGVKAKHYFGNRVFDWQLRYDQGTDWFNAMHTIPGGTDPKYGLTKAQMSLSVPLPDNAGLWRTSLQGQSGNTTTPTSAQLYAGNRYNVRGYQDNSLYGATGAWWRNDLESKAYKWDAVAVTPYVGLDAGHVKPNTSQTVSQHHLVGCALGFRVEQGSAKADIAYTRSLSRPEEFAQESRGKWLAHLSIAL
jgi:hemolysin activation/secretion protein